MQLVAAQPHRAGHLGVLGQQADDRHRAWPTCPNRIRRRCATTSPGSTWKFMPRTARDPLGVGGEGDGQIASPPAGSLTACLAAVRGCRDRARRAVRRRSGWRTTRSAPAPRPGTGTPTGTWSPTSCRRRSACPARRRAAGRRNPGSSARFRRGSPAPTLSAVSMIRIDATFGRMWRAMIRRLRTPIYLAAGRIRAPAGSSSYRARCAS